MRSKIVRICEVKCFVQSTCHISTCELQQDEFENYSIKVISDPNGIFEDFEIDIEKSNNLGESIFYFEKECLNRFTCFGEFSLEFIKAEHGDEIKFK